MDILWAFKIELMCNYKKSEEADVWTFSMFVKCILRIHIVLCSKTLQGAPPVLLGYSLNKIVQLEFSESDLEQLYKQASQRKVEEKYKDVLA